MPGVVHVHLKTPHMLAEAMTEDQIRSAPCPSCAVCGGPGRMLYSAQQDRLFGASGVWNLKECTHRDCGAIWLDPMPVPEDLWKAYANYYTHSAGSDYKPASGSAQPRLLRRVYETIKRGHLANRFGYRFAERSAADAILGRL